MKKAIRKIGRITLWILFSLFFIFGISIIWFKTISPGKTEAFIDSNGDIIENSVAEINHINIGGIDQFIIIRGENVNNPVLLMLHGGPGSPQAHLNLLHNKELEKHFIVVNWDQRGAGGSYNKEIPKESITIDQFIEDTYELSNYLKKRFNKEKIYLLGHSWGSYLGMRTIHKYPDPYFAYISIGQVANQRLSEDLSYEFVLNKAKENNNTKAIAELESIGTPINGEYKNPAEAIKIQRKWVTEYGGAAYGKTSSDFFGVFLKPLFTFREYKMSDKLNYVKGMLFSQALLWPSMINQQLPDIVKEVHVPVYLLQGKHDYQTLYPVAKTYFDSLQAPQKQFIEFSNSAHLVPYNKEKDKFHDILINKVLPETLPTH